MPILAATADKAPDDASLDTAQRCWTWRWCGCLYVDDCRLLEPLPVHGTDEQAARAAA
jgi:hypothetical protein